MSTWKPESIMESFDECETTTHKILYCFVPIFPFVIAHQIYKTYKRRKENRHLYQKLEEKNI